MGKRGRGGKGRKEDGGSGKNKRRAQVTMERGSHTGPGSGSIRTGKCARVEPPGSGSADVVVRHKMHGVQSQDEKYWNSMAKKYDQEIYDSFNEALNKEEIVKILDAVANPEHHCIDFGCGVGKYLPALSKRFKSVLGLDLSQSLVDNARNTVVWTGAGRSRQRKLKNVTLGQADLSQPLMLPEKADFACCQNVLLEPQDEAHERILRNICKALKPGGSLMLLVPSLESAIHVGQALPMRMRDAMARCEGSDVILGRLPREGVLTQHFLREHVDKLLRSMGFQLISCTKLEYSWRHEFGESEEPRLARCTPPWDWLILCKLTV
eukprot:m.259255 g.259255  ORF g.259255 m.259255 type:complete len:323 (+) comp15975_c1_seq5:2784-3752(+)